jgi:MtfA peptidase
LVRNVAQYRLLSEEEKQLLRDDTRIFVAEKFWEGCRGLRITEEIKVTIAGQACLMLLGRKHDFFGRARSVLVYPSAFYPPRHGWQEDERGPETFGLAVYRGPVILAWDTVLAEGRDLSSGDNVVIHEFAHHLDFLDGSINGTPDLHEENQGERWHDVMTAEYTRLQRDLRKGRATFLGDYAASNEGEFFAVASERFFTRPGLLWHYHPALYEMLAEYYELQPMTWFAREGTAPYCDFSCRSRS